MPLNVPSAVTVTVGTIEIVENAATTHYQQFVLTSPEGVALGSTANPIPMYTAVSGNYVSNFNIGETVVPVGGAFYEESLNNTLLELQTSELSVNRLTVRGSLKTAGDGRVNELVGSSNSGYDDIYVASGVYAANNLNILNANGSFFTLNSTTSRHFYIPMIRSGWRALSFSFLAPVSGSLSIHADFGSLTRDILVTGLLVLPNIRYGLLGSNVTTSGSLIGIPALSAPVNGFIISFDPAATDVGSFEIHITRGA
jgi:hypothetical protein